MAGIPGTGKRLLRIARSVAAGVVLMFVRHLPGSPGVRLRQIYYGRRLGALGPGTRIDEGVHIVNPGHVFIGRDCWIAANAFLGAGPPGTESRSVVRRENPDYRAAEGELHVGDRAYIAPQAIVIAHGGVELGERTSVSGGAKIYSISHTYRDDDGEPGVPAYLAGRGGGPDDECVLIGAVVIAYGSQVGAQALVMPGVTIGPRTWLGAGGVATRSLPPDRVFNPPPVDSRAAQ